MVIYSPDFINDEIVPLYQSFGVLPDGGVSVRFLVMLNAGFLPAIKYARNDILETVNTERWGNVLEKSGKLVEALEKDYREKIGDTALENLRSYFEDLRSGRRKCLRFSLVEKDVLKRVQKETNSLIFSEPDALETGRYHFIPLTGKDPKGLKPSGYLQSDGLHGVNMKHSAQIYPERKDPKELAKEAGDILGLRQELFLVEAGG